MEELRLEEPPFFSWDILDDFEVVFSRRDQPTEGLSDEDGGQRGHLEEVVPVRVIEKVRMSDDPLPEVHQRLLKFGQVGQTLSDKLRWSIEHGNGVGDEVGEEFARHAQIVFREVFYAGDLFADSL